MGRGRNANPLGGSGLVQECAPTPDYRTDAQDRSCFVFWDLEGEREEGRMEVHVESPARRWQWGTCRSSGPFTPSPIPPGSLPPTPDMPWLKAC